MKYLKKQYVIPALLIGLLAVLVQAPQQSLAAKTPELNKAKTNVQEKKKVTLHLKRAQKKVKWKSSNKAVAVIKGVSGQRSQRVMVYGKKAGTCKITAQSAGRRYSCRLTVKKRKQGDQEAKPEEAKPEEKSTTITQGAIGVYVSGVTATEYSLSVDVTYYNGSLNPGQEACYGESFYIQKKEGDSWVAVEPAEPMAFPAIAILLRNQTEQKKTYKIPKTAQPLTSGRYRICVFLSAGYYSQDAANSSTYQEPVIYNQAEFDVVLPPGEGSVSGTAVPAPSADVTMPGIASATPFAPSVPPIVATAPPEGTPTPACTQNPNVPQNKMGAKVTAVNHTESSIDVTIGLYNGFYDWGLGYSYGFTIEKQVDGEWVTVTSKEPQAFPCVMILLSPQSQGEMTYRITDTESEVTDGHYRLCTELFPMPMEDSFDALYCEKPQVETDFEFDIITEPAEPTASPAIATAPPKGTPTPACTENPNVPQNKMGAKVTAVNHTESSIDVTVGLYNGFYDWILEFTHAFTIEKKVGDEWVAVTSKNPQLFTDEILVLNPQSQCEMTYRITDTTSEVTAGHYRLCTHLFTEKAFYDEIADYQRPYQMPQVETDFEFDIP